MKIRTLLAASAIAATGAVGAVGHSASASCGISLKADNDAPFSVTVNWTESKVRAAPLGVAGSWASLGTTSTNLDADTSGTGDEITKAFNLTFGCGVARQYKLKVTGGGNSWWEYHNEVGPTGSWTTDVTPIIDLELP